MLVRHLDGFGRRSDLYAGVATGRAGYLLLMTLVQIGPATLGRLAAALGLDASTVTRQVAAMEAEGFIARGSDDGDRRRSIISIADPGARLLGDLRARRTERVEALLRDWSGRDVANLGRLLCKLNAAISSAHGQGGGTSGPVGHS